jgi:hypothetical protein
MRYDIDPKREDYNPHYQDSQNQCPLVCGFVRGHRFLNYAALSTPYPALPAAPRWSLIERGINAPSFETIAQMARRLRCP